MIKQVAVKILKAVFPVVLLFSVYVPNVEAGDNEANEEYKIGVEKFKKGHYKAAGETFMDAELLADSVKLKASCVKEAARSYRKGKLLWKEFGCIEKLLTRYPSYFDFDNAIKREFEIADAFYRGHRDAAFWTFRWIPWLTEPDRTIKAYEVVVKRVPFGKQTPNALLRLSYLYIDTGDVKKSLEFQRRLIRDFPGTEASRYAHLELASSLFQLAQKGDGDGKYNAEATRVLKDYIAKYPRTQETEWAKKTLLKTHDIAAKRLLGMAKFYKRIGNKPPAERYLNEVLTKYPETKSVQASESLLVKIDQEYRPTGFRPELESRQQSYQLIGIPEEYEPIMVIPENSGGKWLIPIRKINLGTPNKVAKENYEKSLQKDDDAEL